MWWPARTSSNIVFHASQSFCINYLMNYMIYFCIIILFPRHEQATAQAEQSAHYFTFKCTDPNLPTALSQASTARQ